jgi:hypothetical protein
LDLGGTLINTFVVLAVGAFLTYVTNDRFRTLREDVAGVKAELKADIARVEERLDARIARVEDRLDAGIAEVRSDILRVALAVGAGRSEAQG